MIPLQSKPNTEPPSGAYPFGAIKDDTGANDGTPVDKLVYDDIHQFIESLMSQAGILANGLPDNATNGFQIIQALNKYIRERLASDTAFGVVEIANQTEVDAASDTIRTISPATLNAAKTVMGVDGSVKLRTKVVNIGDWNMDADSLRLMAHGVSDYKKIRSIDVMIRDDSDLVYSQLLRNDIGVVQGNIVGPAGATLTLERLAGGIYDSTGYDSTSFNRGWVTIIYEV